jgi:uncharacterized protein
VSARTRTSASWALRLWLAVEFTAIYGGGPLAILAIRRAGILFLALWLGAVIAWLGTRRRETPPRPDFGRELRGVMLRFMVLAPLVTLTTWLVLPDLFLSLPRDRPVFWAIIMVLYPLLSVWPQEMLYRALLFHRYARILPTDGARIAASAITFGVAHVIFLNWVAIAMTAAGGLLFARDYARHRSLRVTCIEHSLYGCLIFTVGLGRFFYTGAAWHH